MSEIRIVETFDGEGLQVFPSNNVDSVYLEDGSTTLRNKLLEIDSSIKIIDEKPLSLVGDIPELKKSAKILLVQERIVFWKAINHKNNLKFLQNVLGYVLKFVNRTRKRETKSFFV